MLRGIVILHHLVHDKLMPQSVIWQHGDLVRRCLVALQTDASRKYFFNSFMMLLAEAGVADEELMDDIRELALLQNNAAGALDPEMFPPCSDEAPGMILFCKLVQRTCLAIVQYANHIRESATQQVLKEYKIRQLLKQLQQLLVDNQQAAKVTVSAGLMREQLHYMLGFVIMWILQHSRSGSGILPQEELMARFHRTPEYLRQDWPGVLYDILSSKEKPREVHHPDKENRKSYAEPADSLLSLAAESRKIIPEITQMLQNYQKQTKKDHYLTPKEARKLLNISNTTLCKWRRAGKLRQVRSVGNRYEYSQNEIKAVLKHRNDQKSD